MSAVAGFALDCDGTLLDTENGWTLAERAAVSHFGGTWNHDLKRSFVGRSVLDTAELIAQSIPHRRPDPDVVYRHMLASFDAVVAAGDVAALPGARDLLRALSERDIPAAVVSNSPFAQVEAALVVTGLRHWPQLVLCAESGIAPKPAPDLYARACQMLPIAPASSVAIEDSAAGLAAARAAGLYTLAVPSPFGRPEADEHIPALWPLDLDALLRRAAIRGDRGADADR